jgi:hypothetical protein
MSIKINDDLMCLEIEGQVIATARQRPDGRWEVGHWLRFFDRNQAITALTITELLEAGYRDDDQLVAALREELR